VTLAVSLAMAIAAMQAGASSAPAATPDPKNAPKIAPNIPLVDPAAPKSTARDEGPIAQLEDGVAPPSVENVAWKDVPDTTRYLMIMGTTDGFAAAGGKAPCFVGRTSEDLDKALSTTPFAAKDPAGLPEALSAVTGSAACTDDVGRSYGAGFLRKLSDTNLAVYLTSVVRGYTRIHPCGPQGQGTAAKAAAVEFFTAADDAAPVPLLRRSLTSGCAVPAASPTTP
jgi:hypothetical protein